MKELKVLIVDGLLSDIVQILLRADQLVLLGSYTYSYIMLSVTGCNSLCFKKTLLEAKLYQVSIFNNFQ